MCANYDPMTLTLNLTHVNGSLSVLVGVDEVKYTMFLEGLHRALSH
jgi:hypothetical protein